MSHDIPFIFLQTFINFVNIVSKVEDLQLFNRQLQHTTDFTFSFRHYYTNDCLERNVQFSTM